MLTISNEKLTEILNDFNIHSEIVSISELQRSHYEENVPASKEVRLIVKVELENGRNTELKPLHFFHQTGNMPGYTRLMIMK